MRETFRPGKTKQNQGQNWIQPAPAFLALRRPRPRRCRRRPAARPPPSPASVSYASISQLARRAAAHDSPWQAVRFPGRNSAPAPLSSQSPPTPNASSSRPSQPPATTATSSLAGSNDMVGQFASPVLSVAADAVRDLEGREALHGLWTR